ncbi:MAG: hypothetical protein KGN84_13710 [Acidobacteriota bacterium]|nr:hypothetical protein [Acidobacteriota bacterium]
MNRDRKHSLPTLEWLEALLDRKLEELVEALEAGEPITPLDFERLMQYHKDKYPPPDEIPEIIWVDDWDGEEAA